MESANGFPPAIQEIWRTLRAKVVWLHGHWIIYRQLYGTSPERIDVLNRSAGTFFYVVQRLLLGDVQLSLSKLGDPSGEDDRKNLTLSALIESLELVGEHAICMELNPLLHAFDTACAKLRTRRNKLIAHFDQEVLLNSRVKPLEGPSRDEIEGALDALRKIMNCAELHYSGSQTAYEHFIMNADGDSLIPKLEQGLRYQELVLERVIPLDDLHKSSK